MKQLLFLRVAFRSEFLQEFLKNSDAICFTDKLFIRKSLKIKCTKIKRGHILLSLLTSTVGILSDEEFQRQPSGFSGFTDLNS